MDLHSPYCRYLRHPFAIFRKYCALLTVILPTSWLSIPILVDWQLISDIISHFHNHAYLLAPLGEELFPLGFTPDINCDTLASALRKQFELPIPLTRLWRAIIELNYAIKINNLAFYR